MTWYALVTKPQEEKQALVQLVASDYAAWLPMAMVERRHGGRGRRVETVVVALYTRYIFANLADGQGLEVAVSCHSIVDVLRTRSGVPWVIPDWCFVDTFHHIEEAGGIIDLRPRTITEHMADDRDARFKLAGHDADPTGLREALDIRAAMVPSCA